MAPRSCRWRRPPVSIFPAASAQNMNASSASGLCARWIVRDASAATRRLAGRHLLRLVAEGVEVLRVLAVLRPLARALRRLVLQERPVGAYGARCVVGQLQRAGAQHEPEQVRGRDSPDRVGLRSEEHTSELQSQSNLVCRLLLEKK